MFLGIDIGSSSSKAAIIDGEGRLLGTEVINLGTGSNAVDKTISKLLDKIGKDASDILFSVATGYGRMNYKAADAQITEITCHGKGVSFFYPQIRTIIDIGGQDSKVIRLDQSGNIENFGMNEKCAAGTGRFLEVMARVLGTDLTALSKLAGMSTSPVVVSSVCTVFAESEVISHLSAGARIEDVAKGAHISVAKRVCGMCGRVGIVDDIAMTGGGALNSDLVECFEQVLGKKIFVPESPQAIGAIGAAILAKEKYNRKTNE